MDGGLVRVPAPRVVAGRRGWVILGRLVLLVCVLGLVFGAAGARAATTLYAYADGTGTPAGCPAESTPSTGCSLQTALGDAQAGDTVMLATRGPERGRDKLCG